MFRSERGDEGGGLKKLFTNFARIDVVPYCSHNRRLPGDVRLQLESCQIGHSELRHQLGVDMKKSVTRMCTKPDCPVALLQMGHSFGSDRAAAVGRAEFS